MMSAFTIQASFAIFPGGVLEKGPVYVTIVDGKISKIQKQATDHIHNCVETHLLTAGFIDIHTHGFGGSDDITESWLNPEFTLQTMPSKGTTSCLASIVFPKDFKMWEFAEIFQEYVGKVKDRMAVLEGVHAEGPVVNDCGGLPQGSNEISLTDFVKLIDAIPSLKIMTISPHLESKTGYSRLRALLDRGIVPSLGHDKVASEEDILGALRQSTKPLHMTHVFNVCSFHHRSPSLVNFGMVSSFPDTDQYKGLQPPTVEVIGDLAHVHPLTLMALIKSRGFHDICFVTDSVYLSSIPGEKISYNARTLTVSSDCQTMILEGSNTIAGSCCSMLDIFYNLINVLKVPVEEVVTMLTENPARVANLNHTGSLSEGKRADLLLFDKDYRLTATIVAGNICWNR